MSRTIHETIEQWPWQHTVDLTGEMEFTTNSNSGRSLNPIIVNLFGKTSCVLSSTAQQTIVYCFLIFKFVL